MEANDIPCASGRYWQVKKGDTLYLVATISGTSVDELIRLNPGIEPENLAIGRLICLPPEPVCPSAVFWIVAEGDTLYRIAGATGTTVEELLELNPFTNPLNLLVGQRICLPG